MRKARPSPIPGYRRIVGVDITIDVRHNSIAEAMYAGFPVCLVKE